MVSVILTSSIKSQAETISDLTDKTSATPAGNYCYDKDEVKRIAHYAKACEENQNNLRVMDDQFNQCLQQIDCKQNVIGSQVVFWGSVALALIAGFTAGVKVSR